MADLFSKKKRSQIMAAVKNKETIPEVLVRKALFARGFRYRINKKSLPGSPDIVLPKYKIAIFVHGCFWHGHKSCSRAKLPKSNINFWKAKIRKNRRRDLNAQTELKKLEWKVITVWGCQLKNEKLFEKTISGIVGGIEEATTTFRF